DGSASRSYYTAFHALTSLFALEGKTFTKHSALRSAIHRDLVQAGRWEGRLARDFDFLMDLREAADYGGLSHVTPDSASIAADKAAFAAPRRWRRLSRAHPKRRLMQTVDPANGAPIRPRPVRRGPVRLNVVPAAPLTRPCQTISSPAFCWGRAEAKDGSALRTSLTLGKGSNP
ncbi:MAG: HEPN domain-containing protein, partial [Phycisphaerae bacterium]|nr:HEPN domain-containing protein [Phycisphaerae bacterium]